MDGKFIMKSSDEHIQDVLIKFVKKNYLPKKKSFSLKFFAPKADELSKAFTSERNSRPKNYFNIPPYRAAYLLYFYLQTYHKTLFAIQSAKKFGFKIGNVLDLGAGSGAAGLASAKSGSKKVVLVDQSKKSLADANQIGSKLFPNVNWVLKNGDAVKLNLKEKFNCIIAANFLNEIPKIKRFRIITNHLNNSLEEDGCMILIEPALRFVTRDLMHLRNELAKAGYNIVAPCLHQRPCPMLKMNNRDWCHMYLNWKQPSIIKNMDKIIKRNHRYLKFSYLIISRIKHETTKNKALIVSSPLISKGKTELLACSSCGKLERLKELHRSKNQRLRGLNRGDIIDFS